MGYITGTIGYSGENIRWDFEYTLFPENLHCMITFPKADSLLIKEFDAYKLKDIVLRYLFYTDGNTLKVIVGRGDILFDSPNVDDDTNLTLSFANGDRAGTFDELVIEVFKDMRSKLVDSALKPFKELIDNKLSMAIKQPKSSGVRCKECNEWYEYAEGPNQEDGSFVCYSCRKHGFNAWKYKGARLSIDRLMKLAEKFLRLIKQ